MKYIPVTFGIDFNDDIPMLFGSFCKFACYAAKNGWPIIAQEQYFDTLKKYNQKFLEEVYEINEIEVLNDETLNNLDKFIIKKSQTNKVIKEFGNKNDAWIKLMNEKSEELFSILDNKINDILKIYNDIGAIIVWRHNHTVSLIAKKYGLPVIEMELSGVRKRIYKFGLSYFQFTKKYTRQELDKRYDEFKKELSNYKKELPFLTRKEILCLILNEDKLKLLEKEEKYDIGIALGLQKDFETISSGSITNEEILENVLKIEKENNILIRKHPLDANYKYDMEDLFTVDKSSSSIEFLTKCHKIISSVSNINFEAMLLGKTCYTLGKMPFARFSYETLKYNDEYVINIYDLNFLFFCYYVPYSLCLENDYLDFRLSNPTQIQIYLKHYNFIKDKIMVNNNSKFDFNDISIRSKYLKEKNQIIKLKERVEKLDNENKAIIISNEELTKEIKGMVNSKSWKITKPLRKITSYISRKN